MKLLPCVLCVLSGAIVANRTVAGQNADPRLAVDSIRAEIERGVVAGDLGRVSAARQLAERGLAAAPSDPLLLHYRGYALFREASLRADRGGNGSEDESRKLFEEADRALAAAENHDPLPETFAVRSAVIGRLIGTSIFRGIRLGPRASGEMDKALAAGPNNPRVWLLRGISAFFAPRIGGGGLGKADEYLRRACALFASDQPGPPSPAWGAADAHAWLGQVFEKRHFPDSAASEYRTALAAEPESVWIKKLLAKVTQSNQ